MTKTKLLPVLTLAVAVPLAACSSSTTASSPTTTAPTTTAAAAGGSGASSTTAGSGAAGSGSTGSTAAAGTGAAASGSRTRAEDCAAYAGLMPEVYAQPVTDEGNSTGNCQAKLGNGDRIEIVWNQHANSAASFATITTGLDPVTVTGADDARGGADDQGAQVKVLVNGQGAYELYLTPDFVSARTAGPADVDALVTLGAAILRERR